MAAGANSGRWSDLITHLKNGVLAMNNLAQTIGSIFPSSAGTTANSATAGAATALPAQPAGYLNVSIGGQTKKIPFYNS